MERIGKYRVVRELGKGATAVVYLCDDPDEDRQVAVKLVRFDSDNAAVSRRLRKLFQTEDAIARRLDHANIVKIYEAVVEENQAYIAMEYVDGVSLEDFCRIDRLLPLYRVVGIIFKCCLALDHPPTSCSTRTTIPRLRTSAWPSTSTRTWTGIPPS